MAENIVIQNTEKTELPELPALPALEGISFPKQVREACEYILLINNKTSPDPDKFYTSKELFNKAKEIFPRIFSGEITATFAQYVNNACWLPECNLIKLPGRGHGYYLAVTNSEESSKNILDDGQVVAVANNPAQRIQREMLLYPFLESWLIAQGYQAADVSSGKSMGKWGNPDVAGISALDTFGGGSSIELVTIEAKTSLNNWEQLIFEAVSHRRFANRSYFAFTHAETMVNKIPPEMRYYAELYNIGVLVLSLRDEKYSELHTPYPEKPLTLSYDDVEIIEIFSAPYNFVQPKYQLQFCEAVGISCLKKLYQWGRTDE